MKQKFAVLALCAAVTLGAASAQAATVASEELSWLEAGILMTTITTAGDYTLDFSGEPVIGSTLGVGAYSLDGGLTDISVFTMADGGSISLGYLSVGTDFLAALWALGGPLTVALTLVETPPVAPVPVPASLPLLAGAFAAMGCAARRRRKSA